MTGADVLRAAELLRMVKEIRQDVLPQLVVPVATDRRGKLMVASKDAGGGPFNAATGHDGGEVLFVVIGSELLQVAVQAVLDRAQGMLIELGVEA
jgi:hypothetical protein